MKKNLGFTLIETIVVVGIIVIITSSGLLVSINSYRIKSLESAESMLKTGLTKARDEAFYGKKPEECPEVDFNGNRFGVYGDQGEFYYKINYLCDDDVLVDSEDVGKYFGGNILITSSSNQELIFRSVKRIATNPQTFSICINNDGECNPKYQTRTITVDNYGNFSYETISATE